eukprot:gnl/MRDRNA2_/MRDRNA2_79145_c0_seq1.p1 gnl/MRDRNA2_/MRDRNA2_79145_c0~~gnl/MRDRNA2_/MRDRNA2_79145_c0_seq1.p1  ORF type:complete len:346 (-),score=53.96 gnl/MRDRNA2_/MRDRNA2_79145_c0_seq1:420-1457(-)
MNRFTLLFLLGGCAKRSEALRRLKTDRGVEFTTAQTQGCGVVQYAFGAEHYLHIGLRAAQYIRALKVEKGWCSHDLDLDHIPVTLFTDVDASSHPSFEKTQTQGVNVVVLRAPTNEIKAAACGPSTGVECHPEDALPKYPLTNGMAPSAGGNWKYRWYHAQVLLQSPYDLTFYLDADAVPCSGEGMTYLVKKIDTEHADVGAMIHSGSCQMSPSKKCKGDAPEGADKKEWAKFFERNAGVIAANMTKGSKGRKIIEDFAQGILDFAGKAHGDQYAFRRSLFMHKDDSTQSIFHNDEVCRYQSETSRHVQHTGDMCEMGCKGISHQPSAKSIEHIPSKISVPEDLQ